jgi:Protein of unknown function (DUF3303)
MLFMVIEHFKRGKAPEIYRRFREHGRMAPDDVKYVASWVDFEFTRCFQVMEAENEARLKEWTKHWEDLTDFEIVPVRTSAEAAAAIS